LVIFLPKRSINILKVLDAFLITLDFLIDHSSMRVEFINKCIFLCYLSLNLSNMRFATFFRDNFIKSTKYFSLFFYFSSMVFDFFSNLKISGTVFI
jgi:hypothetical protein